MYRTNLAGSNFLDLFAGSGGMGFEALSLNAARLVSVESGITAQQNLEKTRTEIQRRCQAQQLPPRNLTLIKEDVSAFLRRASTSDERFDFIWADPPYSMTLKFVTDCSNLVHKLMSPEGVFAIECDEPDLAAILESMTKEGRWASIRDRSWGRTAIAFFSPNY
jgi:16S rRNA G966 N2-methylase RsmD